MKRTEIFIAGLLLVASIFAAIWHAHSMRLHLDMPPGRNLPVASFQLFMADEDSDWVQAVPGNQLADGFQDSHFYTDAVHGAVTFSWPEGASGENVRVFLSESGDGWDTELISILEADAAVPLTDECLTIARICSFGSLQPLCSLVYGKGGQIELVLADATGADVSQRIRLQVIPPGQRFHFSLSVRRQLLHVTVGDHSLNVDLPADSSEMRFVFQTGLCTPVKPGTSLRIFSLATTHKKI